MPARQAGPAGQGPDDRRTAQASTATPRRRSARTILATAMSSCPRCTASTSSTASSTISTRWRSRTNRTTRRIRNSSPSFGPRNIVDMQGDRRGRSDRRPALGQGRQANDRGRRPAAAAPEHGPEGQVQHGGCRRRTRAPIARFHATGPSKANKPFFLWHNSTRIHVWTHLAPKWQDKSGFGLYADAMMELDCGRSAHP